MGFQDILAAIDIITGPDPALFYPGGFDCRRAGVAVVV